MRAETGSKMGRGKRCLLAIAGAALLALGAAAPVAAEAAQAGRSGGEIQPHVIGGTAVPDGKYKFMAAVRDVRNGSTAYRQQFCGGALIDRDSVLTAAHCMETVTAADLRVTVGITDLSRNQGQTRQVTSIFRHPRYTTSAASFRYDAAVLKLSSPVNNIAPVRIPATTSNGFERPGRSATVAGWGNTVKQPPSGNAGSNFPYRMREANVPIVRDSTAKNVYGASYAASLMVAAGREGKDTCQGDSGGPLFIRGKTARYQIGITSFGAGCGARGYPGVYAETNAAGIRPFIFDAKAR